MTAMKKILHIAMSAAIMTAAMGIQSCTSESPFSTDGEGLVKMNVSINSRLTRAMSDTELEENCVVRISDSKGLLHRWVGVHNVPLDVYLKYGSYTAEAWSGVEADYSYDDIFYKGSTDFSVSAQNPTTQVAIVCKITNVVASVDNESVNAVNATDINVNIASSKGGLDLNAESFDKKIYFTMPEGDNTLTYTVTGKNQKGEAFTKTGEIEDVKPAHEYRLKFRYTEGGGANEGGAFFDIVIDDTEVDVNDEVIVYSRPQFSWLSGESIDNQLVNTVGAFTDQTLRIAAFGGFKSIILSSSNTDIISQFPATEIDLINCTPEMISKLNELGIKMQDGGVKDDLYKEFITFTGGWLNSLPASQEEIVLTVTVDDKKGKSNTYDVRIANTDAAIKLADPIIIDEEAIASDLTAVRSTSVTLPLTVADANAAGLAVQYRETGTSAWSTEEVNPTRASTIYVEIKGLNPSTTYEFRTVSGSFDGEKYEFESEVKTFATESKFIIPNASMEEWSTYGSKNIVFPGSDGVKTFWDTGNEGANVASTVLTTGSSDIVHSGEKAAKLESKFASLYGMGKLAAGNIFVGTYDKTSGTNGELTFGRPYDGSHPTKLRVWANYRPGKVDQNKRTTDPVPDGFGDGNDYGQIYVALTTQAIEVKTASESTLFNPNADYIIAYGEQTWTGNFGADGQLAEVNIPLVYREKAKTEKPTHLVIVCSASKYGDYFTGSSTSVMYLDDFELVYE